jgi:hypothetical protein
MLLRILLIALLAFFLFRIIRKFLIGYSNSSTKKYREQKKKNLDYKNIEEAIYKEIKDEDKIN